MPPSAELKPLSRRKRSFVFWSALIVFVLAVPLMVMYAIGYRLDISDVENNIKSVGGMYISSESEDITIYINDEPVQDMRLFRSAAYIQNLESGMHRVHVQKDGVATWVKELPVFAHLVTEAESFHTPIVPQVRLISRWNDQTGIPVFTADPINMFSFASVTNAYATTTAFATSSYNASIEYEYIESIFASSSELHRELQLIKAEQEALRFTFNGTSATSSLASSTATTTKFRQDIALYETGGEVYARFSGSRNDIPYYYCVEYAGESTTSAQYGEHVVDQLKEQLSTTTDLSDPNQYGQTLCRDSIRIDRLRQNVEWFDFYPDNPNIVLLLLEDGLYAVEIDDRAWQNTQLIYPGAELEVVLDGGRIFVKDNGWHVELLLEIASTS